MASSRRFASALVISSALLAGCAAQTTSSSDENLHEGFASVSLRLAAPPGELNAALTASFPKSRTSTACDRHALTDSCWITSCSNGTDHYAHADAGVVRAAFVDTGPELEAANTGGDVPYAASTPVGFQAAGAGASVRITASGGEVPAFTSTLVVPPPLVLDRPSEERDVGAASPEPVAVIADPAHDLELRFTHAAAGARLMMDTVYDGGSGLVACDLEIRGDRVVIPAKALDSARHREFRLIAATVENVPAGEWSVKTAIGTDVWAKISQGPIESLTPIVVRVQ